ncbi:DUF6948 domain-containing protein [Neisseria meningitidis]|uniref:DUF6948 domain-containing protein n=1 Tax=Neisseria meningitidis TaxID=487 RepID=UPI003988D08A
MEVKKNSDDEQKGINSFAIGKEVMARYGIKQEKSRICGELDEIWLEAIEIIPVNGEAAESLRTAPEVVQDE